MIRLAKKLIIALLAVVMICPLMSINAYAAGRTSEGLSVESLSFRDVLRIYSTDKSVFGADAAELDASGVSNAAKRLAEFFASTVGLNYSGIGLNSDFFGKNISSQMGRAPYTDENLLNTYNVEIRPVNGYAVALPEETKTAIRIYQAGYENAASGVEAILHYVWQDNGIWYAVKDDCAFYKVSYNGKSARELLSSDYRLVWNRATGNGTESVGEWCDLGSIADGAGIVHLSGYTLVAGQGTANIFGITKDMNTLKAEGGFSTALLAVSDFVEGDTSYQTGPLVYSRGCYDATSLARGGNGYSILAGGSYLLKVIFDEPLRFASGEEFGGKRITAHWEQTGEEQNVTGFVWYGAESYLSGDSYNPHTIELTFTVPDDARGVCTFELSGLVGEESGLNVCSFRICCNDTAAEPATIFPSPTPLINGQSEENRSAEDNSDAAIQTIPVVSEYSGDTTLTRGMLTRTLWELCDCPDASAASFTDVSAAGDVAKAVAWASEQGLVQGFGDGTFHPDSPVTREQCAVILYRYTVMQGKSVQFSGNLNAYQDGKNVSSWGTEAVGWAIANGILACRSDGSISPRGSTTCGELVCMMLVLCRLG